MDAGTDWTSRLDPNEIWETLVRCKAAVDTECARASFVGCWTQGWGEWRFCGHLGFGGKLWREWRHDPDADWVPHLSISCYSENRGPEVEKIIEQTNTALVKLLVSSGLR